MKKTTLFFCLALLLSSFTASFSQVTYADYARADTVLKWMEKVYSPAVRIQWIGDQNIFWYMNHERGGDMYYLVDAANGRKVPAFDQTKLAILLEKELKETVKPENLPISGLRFLSGNEMVFSFNNASWNYLIRQNRLTKSDEKQEILNFTARRRWGHQDTLSVSSPDNLWEAYVKDHNIYVRTKGGVDGVALTMDGAPHLYYSSQLIWSPDSRRIATLKVRDTETRKIPLIESMPTEQRQPVLQWRDYAKPGDVLPVSLPVLIDVESKQQIALDTDPYVNQYRLYLNGWREDGRGFTFEYNERGHQRYIVAEVSAATGKIRHLVDEQTNTFIYYNKVYKYDLDDGAEMLWASERDGWRHLYLIDGKTGEVLRQITQGEWVMRDVIHVDEEDGWIYFTASGIHPEEDPYNVHYCRIRMDGTGFMDLTPENGSHQVSFSKDRSFFVDIYSRPDLPPVSQLKRTSDGAVVTLLEQADVNDLLAEGWVMPEVFCAKGRDGVTDIWGNIYRPSGFDPSKKYPVVEFIYAGPHDSHVDKIFKPAHHLVSKLVELGFVVVSIDGMGTYNRSKAFHDVCWKNLKDAGFPDRKLWIKAAAAEYPYMDISKVGIYGWSAGGQNAMAALLFHNDFYKVAVAFCGCHDNRMDKIWWNEQWMGYPLDASYSASSNVDNAHLLKGKLFLINGELDDNVDPTSTLQVVGALTKAGKNFDQLYLPGRGHSLGGAYEMRRMHDFFVKHLKNQEPPEW